MKDQEAADKIATKLKNKVQTQTDVEKAVVKMAPGMGTKTQNTDQVASLVKAELKGAKKLKEDELEEYGQHVVVSRDKSGKVVDRKSFKDVERANEYAKTKQAPGMRVAVKSRDVHATEDFTPVKRPDGGKPKALKPRDDLRQRKMDTQIVEPEFDDEDLSDVERMHGIGHRQGKFAMHEGALDKVREIIAKVRNKLPSGDTTTKLQWLKRYLHPDDFYTIRSTLSGRHFEELLSMVDEGKKGDKKAAKKLTGKDDFGKWIAMKSDDKAKGKVKEAEKMKGEDPCWDDYKMVGTKKKGGKEVPNCVPKKKK